ncbi:GNAT family N-acetyltransferase [Paenibacillus alvei]|uniref:GNAT family N-acetyltransferase n=1 Tax=Paenibacillus alvei TaxID=44250 RepID=UPI000287C567|nr:GNAT family protein [Paenibacillus alvei]EJW15464.1 putative GCN5 N-acetyltransferase [Paenibacillus alvei DSM 29]MCY7487725.1 GNAT family N-acetyltransferase [Paenibacillus alvei]MCY9545090.1 GNAT family N-acetyltransferase [Paenibacillus alvei]MCY9706651.1 GNAT family N-acetyltransferase [Paenibacillus alvei]MCY9736620.1 GNAT family N-acetyltransferase [Paenibacillus alvei]
MFPIKINGERIGLSRIAAEDLDFICELECNKDIWFFEESVESDKEIVREKYLENMDSPTHYDFIITRTIEGEARPIGLAQIWSYVEHRKSWELGFAIIPEYQGHGYGNEAVNLLLEFSFHHLQAHKVVGMCNGHNQKSMKLMERLGMRREGIFKDEICWNNQWVDQYFYSILDIEYQNR